MPTLDEQPIVPSLGVESDVPPTNEGGEDRPYVESGLTQEAQRFETLLGDAPSPVKVQLKFRQQPIPRADAGEVSDSRSDELIRQKIRAAASMGDQDQASEVVPSQGEAEVANLQSTPEPSQDNHLSVESFFSARPAGVEQAKSEESTQASSENPAEINHSLPVDHDHNLDMVADPEAIDRHGHAGQEAAESDQVIQETAPSSADLAEFADFFQKRLEQHQQEYIERVQQAA